MNQYIREYEHQAKYSPVTVSQEVFIKRAEEVDAWISTHPISKDWYENIDGVGYYEAARLTDEEWTEAMENQDSILNYAMMRCED